MIGTLLKHEVIRTRGFLLTIAAAGLGLAAVGSALAITGWPVLSQFGLVLGAVGAFGLLPAMQLALAVDYWRSGYGRIGYFTQSFTEYGRPENRAMQRAYIDRFRLEKKDPSAALSEPVKPITFYLAREVPTKWRAAMKKGVEQWNVAFEQAGFKNAILCKDAPSEKEDPDWDAEDARYSVIRWAPSATANANSWIASSARTRASAPRPPARSGRRACSPRPCTP